MQKKLTKEAFELLVFYSDPKSLLDILTYPVSSIVVDLEKKDKQLRQLLYDTQITEHTTDDLRLVRELTHTNIICRINAQENLDKKEIDETLDAGANELLIPMVKTMEEVERVLNYVSNRAEVSIMLETNEAFGIISDLETLPLTRYYVGLNDLAVQNKRKNIFLPMIDGTIEKLRLHVTKKFGIAGLTHPNSGHPIPCAVLIRIMQFLNCSFGILRRSFYRDLAEFTPSEIFRAIENAFQIPISVSSISENDKEIIANAFSDISYKPANKE